MDILAWIILGGLAGWIASMVTGDNPRMGIISNILVGIVGAALGGWLSGKLLGEAGVTGFNLSSLVVATLGAIVLLFIVGLFRPHSTHKA